VLNFGLSQFHACMQEREVDEPKITLCMLTAFKNITQNFIRWFKNTLVKNGLVNMSEHFYF